MQAFQWRADSWRTVLFQKMGWSKGAGCRNGLGMEAETVGGYGGDYGELKESWIGKRGFIRYWDEQAKVPYLFDGGNIYQL